ncbi:GFA family protein [Saccharospirillum salsuginis]|uniref:CENP-V/GFA domain-containing protein n=1 Tax=Saccharospirillum salsuginis TaxID=418750 RepID=A0A918KSF1_9GAMM|nr:hypothetical protein [Saccharospirillum salsuginis]GGX74283.1 hypothetical protein GCM10007392_47070 [Saccharospirillum salsuginis]
MTQSKTLTCDCGQVTLDIQNNPIVSTECLCADCQEAGAQLQALPGAKPLLDRHRATRFVLYRKDRVQCTQGRDRLREHRLTPQSPTRRVVAVCCNTPIFLEFAKGHWLSLYGNLWPAGSLPALDLRTMTRDRPEGVDLPDDVPNPQTHNLSFMARLLFAWAAIGFRAPKIDYVQGALNRKESGR